MNKKRFKKGLLLFCLFFFPFGVLANDVVDKEVVLVVSVVEEKNEIAIKKIQPGYGFRTGNVEQYRFVVKSLDIRGEVVDVVRFDFPEVMHYPDPDWFDPVTGEQVVVPDFGDVIRSKDINLPYSGRIKFVAVSDKEEKELFRVEIEDYIDYKILDALRRDEKAAIVVDGDGVNDVVVSEVIEGDVQGELIEVSSGVGDGVVVKEGAGDGNKKMRLYIVLLVVFVAIDIWLGWYIWKRNKHAG